MAESSIRPDLLCVTPSDVGAVLVSYVPSVGQRAVSGSRLAVRLVSRYSADSTNNDASTALVQASHPIRKIHDSRRVFQKQAATEFLDVDSSLTLGRPTTESLL